MRGRAQGRVEQLLLSRTKLVKGAWVLNLDVLDPKVLEVFVL